MGTKSKMHPLLAVLPPLTQSQMRTTGLSKSNLVIASNLSVLLLAINKLKCYHGGDRLIYKTSFSRH